MGICEAFSLLLGMLISSLLENVICQNLTRENYNVTLHSNNQSWEEANTACNLAGTGRLDEIRLGLKQFTIPTLKIPEVWIGAHLDYTPWLNLTGCEVRSFDQRVNGVTILSSADPIRECSQRCFGDFFLTYDMCYCSNVINPSYTQPMKCKADPCPRNNDQFCGKQNDNACVCHYKKFRFNEKSRIGNCMTAVIINQNEIQLQNENCEKMYKSACDGFVQFSPMTWAQAGFQCYFDNKQYSSKLNIGEEKNTVSQLWIAALRRPIIRWRNSKDVKMSNCVTASRNITGSWQLNVRPCEDKLPFLCHGDINFKRSNKIVEIYFAITFSIVGTIIILFVVVMVCRKKNTITLCVFKKECSNGIDHVYHDIDPNFYEEDIIIQNANPICAEGSDRPNAAGYDKVCLENYGRLNLNGKGNPAVITNYDTMGNLICTEHSSYGKLLKKDNVCILSEYDTVEFCKG